MRRFHFAIPVLISAVLAQTPDVPEVRAHQTESSFRIRADSNLVTVRVVIRDTHGRTVGNLKREDFNILDSGKPQELTGFAVESTTADKDSKTATSVAPDTVPPSAPVPQRFVALFFDDLHMATENVMRIRTAGVNYLSSAIGPQDRVAILTSSRKDEVDFTSDIAQLRAALSHLMARSRTIPLANSCPSIGEYQAYQIAELQEAGALAIAVAEGFECHCNTVNPTGDCRDDQMRQARMDASQIWNLADLQSQYSLEAAGAAVRRLAAMPGQRALVLVSPGFLTMTETRGVDALLNLALHQNVIINALDAAGLYTRPSHDWLTGRNLALDVQKTGIEHAALNLQRDVLAGLTSGTGGTYFQNSNNFDEGFRETAQAPEVYYMLSFAPRDVPLNGQFHPLKVTLNTREQLRVEARKGYVAAAAKSTPGVELAFSQEEVKGLPADLTTRVDPAGPSFTLTVRIHVDVGQLHFRKEADRSIDTLKFETVLFDQDGKYVTGKEQSLDLHLKDPTLERLTKEGINAVTKFQLSPGTYRVREIVRDTESTEITALNADVQAR